MVFIAGVHLIEFCKFSVIFTFSSLHPKIKIKCGLIQVLHEPMFSKGQLKLKQKFLYESLLMVMMCVTKILVTACLV